MQQYLGLLKHIMQNGRDKTDRTGTGTRSVFGYEMRFNLKEGFPLLTTKKLHLRSIIVELLWFLKGRTDNEWLKENNVTIWDEWATEDQCKKFGRKAGDLGPVYGHQWRNFGASEKYQYGPYNADGIDQISWVINEIKKNPDSRRLIVSAWNPKEQNLVALPPCHTLFQFNVTDGELSCMLHQRSCDTFLGVPFNIASYALLTMMVAQVCNLKLGEFIWHGGDVHIYKNHFDQVALQLEREPKNLPSMWINPEVKDIFKFEYTDFKLENYDPYPTIKAPISV